MAGGGRLGPPAGRRGPRPRLGLRMAGIRDPGPQPLAAGAVSRAGWPMSSFLQRLASRSLGQAHVVKPRVLSVFEPPAADHAGIAWPVNSDRGDDHSGGEPKWTGRVPDP